MPPVGPTSELGLTNPGALGLTSLAAWTSFVDTEELVPELMWPNSARTYEIMRTDSQVEGLYLGTTLPIRRYNWVVNPNGAREEVVQKFSEDIGLPIQGVEVTARPRRKDRFSWDRHLRHVLLALVFGHAYFEQVGRVAEDGMWRLRKLSPRMPQTISEINVAPDGGLVSIKQNIGLRPPEIPVDRLVAYVWDQEGGNWVGRSMFRQLYKHWLIKDRLLRVDAIKHQRNGMGVPWLEAPPNATPQQIEALNEIAAAWKVGEGAGGAAPAGAKMRLIGTEGSVPDTIESVRYHDEAMARRFLMMFAQLGQTQTGSRALGETFVDFFSVGLHAIAKWIADVSSEHIAEDWVDWNYGEDEPAPVIDFEASEDPTLDIAEITGMVEKGLITVDAELEGWLRQRSGMPARKVEDDEAPSGKAFQYDLELGVITIDERRAQLGLAPLPNGDGAATIKPPEPAAPVAPVVVPGVEPVVPTEPVETAAARAQRELREMAEQAAARTRRKGQEAESHVHQANRWEAPSRPAQSRRLNRVFAAASEVNEAFLPSNPRRQMYEHEVRAATDFSKLETVAQGGVDSLLDKWGTVKEKQIDELASLIKEAKGDLTVLSDIQAKPIGADVLKAEMSTAMKEGAAAAREEAIRQGLKVPAPKLTEAEKQIAARAEAVDRLLARSLSEAASRQAVARSGTSLTPQQVADQVKEYLVNLSESYLKDQFNGAVMQAMNTGRREVMAREAATIYASELADESSCDECVSIDGTEYGSLDDADQDYPTGGYVECRGGPNCRGTLIAVYGESETEQ